jgi:hypothetical protein
MSRMDLAAAQPEAQHGDPDAFRALYRDTQPRLLRYLHALVGDNAEGIASETWLREQHWSTLSCPRPLTRLEQHGRAGPVPRSDGRERSRAEIGPQSGPKAVTHR